MTRFTAPEPPRDALPGEPIDLGHLLRQTSGDRGVLIEVLTLYHTLAPRYLNTLEHSTTIAALQRNLHQLKSAAAGIGAWGVQARIRQIETALDEGRALDPEWIEDLAIAVEEGVRFVEHTLETGRGLPVF